MAAGRDVGEMMGGVGGRDLLGPFVSCLQCRCGVIQTRIPAAVMEIPVILIFVVVIIALCFDFTNGFHDAANAIATVVSTKALTMKQALVMAAVLNIMGAFFATQVAKTIEHGLILDVGTPLNAQLIVLAALGGAIGWNVLTWLFAMPSSSSHAIVGGLVGAGWVYGHSHDILWSSVWSKVVLPMVLSPLIGGLFAVVIMLGVVGARRWWKATRDEKLFHRLQILSGALMAFSHGSNDAQKTMGVITLALISANFLPAASGIPWWVILLCALAMGLGTLCGGRRIIETAGERITKLNPQSGFAANIAGSATILAASQFGMPVSTTHVVVGGITGAGIADAPAGTRADSVHWSVWRHMAAAWILTLPGSALFGALLFLLLRLLFHP